MDAAAELASATATAIPAAVVTRNGTKVASRAAWGGYTRITGTTSQVMEVGDTMPGQPIYDSVVPFYTSSTRLTDITIVGGLTFDMTYTIPVDYGLSDITGGTVSAQVRAGSTLLATFRCEVVAPNQVRFLLSPTHTQQACSHGLTSAKWDAEVLLDGAEYGIVPLSSVKLVPSATQVNGSYPDEPALSDGVAYNATVVVT